MNHVTKTHVKYAAAGVAVGGALLAAGAGVAGAEPTTATGAVDLSIGNVKILQNAQMEKAVSVAGAVCDIDASQANKLAQQATTESNTQTVCTLPGGLVTFSQSSSMGAGAEVAPAPAVGTPERSMTPSNDMAPMAPMEQQPS